MDKLILQIIIMFAFCGVVIGVEPEVAWIPGNTQVDFSRSPANPTTNDLINFVISTDVFDNMLQAEKSLGGTPTLIIDPVQKRIDLEFVPPPPPEPIPTTYDPVSGLQGHFGPLEAGSWTLYAQFQGVIYIDPFIVVQSHGGGAAMGHWAERFVSNADPFDLPNKSILFSPAQGGMSYTTELTNISQLPTDPSGGVNLGLGDDTFRFVKLTGSATVSIYGSSFTGFYVGSNGYITFTEGDQDYSESLQDHFDTLRVSGLFRDLSPSAGGQVSIKQLADRAVVTWQNVPEYGSNNSSAFQIALYYDGRIRISFDGVDARQGIVGLSDGLGVPADFQETDFSELSAPPPPPPPVSGDPVEVFSSGADAFDLSFTSLTLDPTGGGTSYGVQIQDILELPTDPSGGSNLALGDDDFAFVKLAGSNTVSIYGNSFTGLYIGSNGYITFTEGDQDYSESLADHYDTLRVSSLFHDLNPSAGGQVTFKQLADHVAVTWQNVPEYGSNNSNTFQIALYYNGRIRISWEHIDAVLGIVGLSDGLGVPADFQETDFSELSGPQPPPVSGYPVEQFTSGADTFDLENMSLTLNPAGGGASYTAEIEQITKLPTEPSGGTNLGLGDDSFSFVKLAGSATVSIYGASFTGFYVGSNGYITFTEGDQDYSESLEDHYDTLRVSGLFHDLNPSAGGQISWRQLADRVAVTWQNVPEYGNSSLNTFQIELFFDSRIRLSWLAIAAESGIVGLSDGAGVPPDFQETDFSELSTQPPPPPPINDFLTEEFASSADSFDLENKSVMFTPTADGSSYIGSLQSISQLPTNPSGSTNLGLGDDVYVSVLLRNQARVKIFNQNYSRFYVGSNGYITFTQGDRDFSQSLAEHFTLLRISSLYCDLTASNTGSIVAKQLNNRVAVTWLDVPEYSNTARNTFQIEMFYDGRIRISWLEINADENIVGLSNGLGLPIDFEETDFSVQYAQP
jgi:hypothetical protein